MARMVTTKKLSNITVEMNIVKKNPNNDKTADHLRPILSSPQMANKSEGNSIIEEIVNVQ